MSTQVISTSRLLKSFEHHCHPFHGHYTLKQGDKEQVRDVYLKTSQKVKALAIASFVGLLTLPLLVVGGFVCGYSAFVIASARYKRAQIQSDMQYVQRQIPHTPAAGDQPASPSTEPAAASGRSTPTPPPAPAPAPAPNTKDLMRIEFENLKLKCEQLAGGEAEIPEENQAEYDRTILLRNAAWELYNNFQEPATGADSAPVDSKAIQRQIRAEARKAAAAARKKRLEETRKAQAERKKAAAEKKEILTVDFDLFYEHVNNKLSEKYGTVTPQEILEVMRAKFETAPPTPQHRELDIPLDGCELPPTPAQPIKVGLINMGNTCWLNSMLKFLAVSEWGDGFCQAEPIDEEYRNIQSLLKKVLISLRTGPEDTVVNSQLLHAFILSIVPLMPPGSVIPGEQQEARELLARLSAGFNYPTPRCLNAETNDTQVKEICAQKIVSYKVNNPAPGMHRRPIKEAFTPDLAVKCLKKHLLTTKEQTLVQQKKARPAPLDLNDLVSEVEENSEINPKSYYDENTHSIQDYNDDVVMDPILAQKSLRLVHAPQKLVLTIDRAVPVESIVHEKIISENADGTPSEIQLVNGEGKPIKIPRNVQPFEYRGACELPVDANGAHIKVAGTYKYYEAKKCDRPILFRKFRDENNTVMLREYNPEARFNSTTNAFEFNQLHDCHYRVKGAVVHYGQGANSGHYIYIQRLSNERYQVHSDDTVYEMGEAEASAILQRAVFLELELIEKTAPAPEQESATQQPASAAPKPQVRKKLPLPKTRATPAQTNGTVAPASTPAGDAVSQI